MPLRLPFPPTRTSARRALVYAGSFSCATANLPAQFFNNERGTAEINFTTTLAASLGTKNPALLTYAEVHVDYDSQDTDNAGQADVPLYSFATFQGSAMSLTSWVHGPQGWGGAFQGYAESGTNYSVTLLVPSVNSFTKPAPSTTGAYPPLLAGVWNLGNFAPFPLTGNQATSGMTGQLSITLGPTLAVAEATIEPLSK